MNEQVLDWLLEEKEPSIRYRTLTELLDKPDDDWEVIAAKEKMVNSKTALRLLAKQDENGLWAQKDYGTMTDLRYLTVFAELGFGKDIRLNNAIDLAVRSMIDSENTSVFT